MSLGLHTLINGFTAQLDIFGRCILSEVVSVVITGVVVIISIILRK